MRMVFLALGGAAVAMTAVPAEAKHHGRHHARAMACAKMRHGHCIAYRTAAVRHMARWRTGYVFGPNYGYTAYTAVPRTYRVRYHLSPDYRYVYNNGYIYVVDPTTYAITRILNAL